MRHAILAVALAFGVVGCTADRAEVREEGTETRARVDDERMAYERQLEARLERIDEQMEERREEMRERKLDARAQREYEEQMAELERARAEARQQFEQLKNATAEGWRDMKQGLDEATDKLERSWNRFVADAKT